MGGFHDVLFPESVAYGATGGPQFSTRVAVSAGGGEQRLVMWDRPRLRYHLATGIQSRVQMQEVLAFFRARKGRAFGFRFHDWMDDRATGEPLGTGDGERTLFPLVKHYLSGEQQEVRRIHKPVAASCTVYLDAEPLSSGVTLDTQSGQVTLAVPPGEGVVVTADFRFHVPVRFDSDRLEMAMLGTQSFQGRELDLLELRLED